MYMKNILIFFLTIFLFIGCKIQEKTTIDYQNDVIINDLKYLSSDKLEGRESGSKGEELAAKYIIGRFKALGIKPYLDNEYTQQFSKTIKANPHSIVPSDDDFKITGKNVIGFIDNQSNYNIVIGAHYDHLGYGHEGSLYKGPEAIHNGADDNASGVVALLELAKRLSDKEDQKYNYIMIAFSGEEKGLLGSNFFVKSSKCDPSSINYMLNMDMVGRLNKDRQLAVYGVGTSPIWSSLLKKIKSPKFKYKIELSGVGPSDHTSFYLQDIPVLHFFTGQHSDYHKPTDDAHLVNFEGILDVTQLLENIIERLNGKSKLEFTKTKDESEDVPNFKVTLGVFPDYLFDGIGMRIDGVSEGKPAFRANLEKGDIVIKLGDHEVADMMSYMRALSKFSPGEETTVVVKRGSENISKSIQFNK